MGAIKEPPKAGRERPNDGKPQGAPVTQPQQKCRPEEVKVLLDREGSEVRRKESLMICGELIVAEKEERANNLRSVKVHEVHEARQDA